MGDGNVNDERKLNLKIARMIEIILSRMESNVYACVKEINDYIGENATIQKLQSKCFDTKNIFILPKTDDSQILLLPKTKLEQYCFKNRKRSTKFW